MKYLLQIILAVLTFPAIGQEIEKIIFTSQQADEPPTKQGRPKYAIEFARQSSGEFIASCFSIDKKKKKLKDKITIEIERIEKITDWRNLNKKTFNQSDLGIDISDLKQQNNGKLNFGIPLNLTVQVDSFRFCKTYDNIKTVLLGGEYYTVTLIYRLEPKQEFIFDSNVKGDDFNLQDYIFCYQLLTDRIPKEVPDYGFFSKKKFNDVILYYQKTVECEGFYYKEFSDKNPKMTAKDKRMMKGWDFVEYLRQRNKKE
jgi:hypothetical protein